MIAYKLSVRSKADGEKERVIGYYVSKEVLETYKRKWIQWNKYRTDQELFVSVINIKEY